jgi:hypothetical protein
MKNIEDLLKKIVEDSKSIVFKLPPDIDAVRWVSEHVIHWIESDAGERIHELDRLRERMAGILADRETVVGEGIAELKACLEGMAGEVDELKRLLLADG